MPNYKMRFGINMDNAPLIHIGDAGNISSGIFEAAAKATGHDIDLIEMFLRIGGVMVFDVEAAHNFFELAKDKGNGLPNKDTSMLWSALITASTHNTGVRILFFEPAHELMQLQNALEQSNRDSANASDEHRRLQSAAHDAAHKVDTANRHVARLMSLINTRKLK